MKSLLLLIVAITSIATSSGCALSQVSSDRMSAIEQQLIDSNGAGDPNHEWRRGGWGHFNPNELTPYRIHGGVAPAASSI